EQGHTARCHTDLELGPRPRTPEALLPTTTSSLKLNFFQLRIRSPLLPLLPPVLLVVFIRVLFGAAARGPTACPQPIAHSCLLTTSYAGFVVRICFQPSYRMVSIAYAIFLALYGHLPHFPPPLERQRTRVIPDLAQRIIQTSSPLQTTPPRSSPFAS
ncbi:unnamed protein product, partial [Ixodes pacificus]